MTANNYPSERKSPVRLNDHQKYTIYKYVIENRCVSQNGEDYSFRVERKRVAQEMNLLKILSVPINAHHISDAVEKVINWQKLLDKIPAVPQETVEMEMLKIDNSRKAKEIEELKLKLEQTMTDRMLQSQVDKDKMARAIKEHIAKAILNS